MALRNQIAFIVRVCLALCAALLSSSCDKKEPPPPAVIAVAPSELTREGALIPDALQRVQDKGREGPVAVSFVRCQIKDAALQQLASVPNLRRVDAIGSPLSQAAIDKLKQSVPGVEVVK